MGGIRLMVEQGNIQALRFGKIQLLNLPSQLLGSTKEELALATAARAACAAKGHTVSSVLLNTHWQRDLSEDFCTPVVLFLQGPVKPSLFTVRACSADKEKSQRT